MSVVALDLADADTTVETRVDRTGLVARFHSTASEIDALRPQWRALEAVAPGATVFQSDAWCAAIAAARGLDGAAILTVSDGGNLVAVRIGHRRQQGHLLLRQHGRRQRQQQPQGQGRRSESSGVHDQLAAARAAFGVDLVTFGIPCWVEVV